jgi:hypothetical protein
LSLCPTWPPRSPCDQAESTKQLFLGADNTCIVRQTDGADEPAEGVAGYLEVALAGPEGAAGRHRSQHRFRSKEPAN